MARYEITTRTTRESMLGAGRNREATRYDVSRDGEVVGTRNSREEAEALVARFEADDARTAREYGMPTAAQSKTYRIKDLASGIIHDDIPGDTGIYEIPRGFDREVGAIDVLPGNASMTLDEWYATYGTQPMMLESDDRSATAPDYRLAWLSEVVE